MLGWGWVSRLSVCVGRVVCWLCVGVVSCFVADSNLCCV